MNCAQCERQPIFTSSRSRRNKSNACVRIRSETSGPTTFPISCKEKESVRLTFHSTSFTNRTYESSKSDHLSFPTARTTAGKLYAQYSE
eukprot:gene1441-biopygen1432